jgi:hypothetical protein
MLLEFKRISRSPHESTWMATIRATEPIVLVQVDLVVILGEH